MGYHYYIVNEKRFDSFDMDEHWHGWPHDRKDCFETKEKLLDAVVVAMAAWGPGPHGYENIMQAALTIRDRIWRWLDGANPQDVEFMGEDAYYEYPRGCPPETANLFED